MRIKKLLCIFVLIFIVCMLPNIALAYDYDGFTYNDNDYSKLQAFLNSPSAVEGKTNGEQINADYDENDPTTWSGVAWFTVNGTRHVCQLNWSNKALSGNLNLDGFAKLEKIVCNANQINSITATNDPCLSEIFCPGNKLTSLIVENNEVLTSVSCYYNQLTSLDFNQNPSIVNISCSFNSLTSLNINKCLALANLDCIENQLSALDVSNNTALISLNCGRNPLNSLDVSNNTLLKKLACQLNNLSSLNIRNNIFLEELNCFFNNIDYLDLSKNTMLKTLACACNELSVLDLRNNSALKTLSCSANNLTSLNVSHNILLEELSCSFANLSILDVTHNTALKTLDCNNNNLTSLDVSNNTNLYRLVCHSNKLSSINLRNTTDLYELSCAYNKIASLDLSDCTALVELYCNHNYEMTTLDANSSPELRILECYCNQLTTLNINNCTLLTDLRCDSNKLDKINVTNNIALETLYCSNNYAMTSLDISKNINLVQLNCSGNKLTELDIHNNTKIKYLDFIETKIKKFTANLFGTISTISSNANGYLSIETDSFPTCNIIACPFSGMSFTNWTLNNKIVSTNASYSITAAIPNTLTANFSGSCSVTAIANNTSYGTVTGAGNYNYDDMATVKAFPKAGYRFVRWIDAELSVPTYSRNCIYTFPVCGDKHLKAEFAKIATPSISSSKSSGYNSVTLKWGSVTGANSYNIYRATSKSGTYSKIASTTSTSYKNTSLTTGKTYYYKVKAVCVAGSTTTYSSYSAYKYAKPIPSTPSTTVKSNSYTSIKVSWGKIDGASGYKVYRATSKTGTYSLIKTTTSTSYTNSSLKTGKTYYYKVRAYRTVGSSKVYSSYSAYHSAKPVPSTPTETVSSASYNSIKVSWSKVSGATKYQVYRKTSSTGSYSLIKTTTSTSYTNTSLTTGKTYYYKARAYHLEGSTKVYGPYSKVVSFKLP